MVKNGMLIGYKWNCENGCGVETYPDNFTQMSHPTEQLIMLVCSDCIHDNFLKNWEVDFANDPRQIA